MICIYLKVIEHLRRIKSTVQLTLNISLHVIYFHSPLPYFVVKQSREYRPKWYENTLRLAEFKMPTVT